MRWGLLQNRQSRKGQFVANWERSSDTRNPLDVLIERESRTCKGCRFFAVETCFGEPVKVCRIGMRKVRKCTMYVEVE